MLDLGPIKARHEAASPGEWSSEAWCLVSGHGNTIGEIDSWLDMEFVIAAHNIDIPALIAEVERLRTEVERLEDGWMEFEGIDVETGNLRPSHAALLKALEDARAEVKDAT